MRDEKNPAAQTYTYKERANYRDCISSFARISLSENRNEKVPFRCCVVLFAARKYSLDDTDRESSLALFLVIFETFFSVENGKNCTHTSE